MKITKMWVFKPNIVRHFLEQLLISTSSVINRPRRSEIKVCPEWSNEWNVEGGEQSHVARLWGNTERYKPICRNLMEGGKES